MDRRKGSGMARIEQLQEIERFTPSDLSELREGYVCSWCQLEQGQLMVIPHPQSRQSVRHFDYPSQAEIVGRVTGVAMRIVEDEKAEREAAPR